MVKNKLIKLEDIISDIYFINLEDISYIHIADDDVRIKFKNCDAEYLYTKIKKEYLDKLIEL